MNQGAILLVEDNADDVELALMAFKRNDISNEVIVVWDGAEALDYLFGIGRHNGRDTRLLPSLVLLDLNLPKLRGLDVLRRLRADERTKTLPIVVLSTSSAEPDVRLAYQYGANSYLAKPMGLDHFTELIGQIGNYWLTANVAPLAPE
jgi:two-component system, response regulator